MIVDTSVVFELMKPAVSKSWRPHVLVEFEQLVVRSCSNSASAYPTLTTAATV